MEEKQTPDNNKEKEMKLLRTQKRNAVLQQKAKLLEEMVQEARRREEDARTREADANQLIQQLIARQRELSVMLNRSNALAATMYEANQILAVEFKNAANALPAPKKAELEQAITRIDELFKRTGVPDAQISDVPAFQARNVVEEFEPDFEEDGSKQGGIWSSNAPYKPPVVEAEPVDEGWGVVGSAARKESTESEETVVYEQEDENGFSNQAGDENGRRKWWQFFGGAQQEN